VLCLAQAMLKYPVSKSVMSSSGWDCAGVTDGCASPNIKESLVAWLLMSDQSDEVEESSRPHPIVCRFGTVLLFHIICLTVRGFFSVWYFLIEARVIVMSQDNVLLHLKKMEACVKK